MKLNADERGAFLALQSIIDFYTKEEQNKKEYLQLTTREYRLIKKVFGIDLKEVTYRKKDVKEFARGKDKKENLSQEQKRYIEAWIAGNIKTKDCIKATGIGKSTLFVIKKNIIGGGV